MDRRTALTGIAAFTAAAAIPARAPAADVPSLPGLKPLEFGKKVKAGATSTPVKWGNGELHIIYISGATFSLADDHRLTAKMNTAITPYNKVDYTISVAVFDADGELLGVARHTQSVEYIRISVLPTFLSEFDVDFGISKAFQRAAYFAISISDIDVPVAD